MEVKKNLQNLWVVSPYIMACLLFLMMVLLPWHQWYESKVSISSMLQTSSIAHPLGTDNLGRDLLIRIMDTIKGAVLPLWASVIVGSVVGGFLGVCGIVCHEQMRWSRPIINLIKTLMVILASIPVGVVAFTWAVLQEEAGLMPVLYALTYLFSVRIFLQIFNLYAQDRELTYWQVHHAIGGSLWIRLWKYGVAGTWKYKLMDSLSFHLQAAVTIEASLSFLGFGIQEPQASFGNMLSSHFDLFLKGDWYVMMVIVAALGFVCFLPTSVLKVIQGISWQRS